MKKAKLKSELCFNLSRLYHFQNSLYASFTNLYQQFFHQATESHQKLQLFTLQLT